MHPRLCVWCDQWASDHGRALKSRARFGLAPIPFSTKKITHGQRNAIISILIDSNTRSNRMLMLNYYFLTIFFSPAPFIPFCVESINKIIAKEKKETKWEMLGLSTNTRLQRMKITRARTSLYFCTVRDFSDCANAIDGELSLCCKGLSSSNACSTEPQQTVHTNGDFFHWHFATR